MRTADDNLFIAVVVPDFEAQVAACWDYTLWNRPYVITRQHTGHDRSTVVSLSTYARMMGIHAGMKIQQVKRRYSAVTIIKEDIACQEQARQEMLTVCREFTPEPDNRSYDDVLLLDMGGCRRCYGNMYGRLGELVQQQLWERIGFKYINIGVAGSPFTARLCALTAECGKIKKCDPGFESLVVAGMKTAWLPGFSAETRKRLAHMNLKTIGEVQDMSLDFLRSRLGSEGERLYFMVRGVHMAEKGESRTGKVNASLTFNVNTNDSGSLQAALHYLADRLCYQLRQQQRKTDHITVVATYSDNRTGRQQYTFRAPTWEYPEIYQPVLRMMDLLLKRRVAVRKLETWAGRLFFNTGQLDLFETEKERRFKALVRSVDSLRNKYGFNCLNHADTTGPLHAGQ